MSDGEISGELLLQAVQRIAISPQEATAIADRYAAQFRKKYPRATEDDIQDFTADAVIRRYARWAAGVGGATGLTAVVPGLGTVIAAVGGATADAAVSMKLQVDMCMCLASGYGYDLTNTDAQRLTLLIAGTGTLEKVGGEALKGFAGKAGVRLLRQYLRGAALQTIKAIFRRLGIVFTRKALEKALPFGLGVGIGATANYLLTKFVGGQAKTWFIIDRADGGPEVTLRPVPE
ncbi:MAG: hypothetical protein H6700_04570 [Myxococcales bacterium]|nr:hypothetical protein [Myxococcales bacterium]MCB9531019.1 hypothetical protein [Myxococcales bacterium]